MYAFLRWAFLASALFTAGATLYLAYEYWTFGRDAVAADGTVVDLLRDEDRYRPVFAYETPSGERVEFVSSWSTKPALYSVGDRVVVLYRPDDPRSGRVDSVLGRADSLLVAGFLSIAHGAAAFVLWIGIGPAKRTRRKARKAA